MIFKRTPSQIGRHVELCHPPKILDKVKKIFELLRTKRPGDHVVQVREYGQVCLCGL